MIINYSGLLFWDRHIFSAIRSRLLSKRKCMLFSGLNWATDNRAKIKWAKKYRQGYA